MTRKSLGQHFCISFKTLIYVGMFTQFKKEIYCGTFFFFFSSASFFPPSMSRTFSHARDYSASSFVMALWAYRNLFTHFPIIGCLCFYFFICDTQFCNEHPSIHFLGMHSGNRIANKQNTKNFYIYCQIILLKCYTKFTHPPSRYKSVSFPV